MNANIKGPFIQPNWKGRLFLAVYVVLLFLLAWMLINELERATPPVDASSAQIQEAVESLRRLLKMFLVITLLHAVCFSWYLVRLASNAIRSGEFPPPGTWVIVQTRVRRGNQARASAYAAYFLAVVMWLPVMIPLYLEWVLMEVT